MPSTEYRCPHCGKTIGGAAKETDGSVSKSETRIRLGIVLVNEDGTVHGPCPNCKGDVVVANGASLSKSFAKKAMLPGLPRSR